MRTLALQKAMAALPPQAALRHKILPANENYSRQMCIVSEKPLSQADIRTAIRHVDFTPIAIKKRTLCDKMVCGNVSPGAITLRAIRLGKSIGPHPAYDYGPAATQIIAPSADLLDVILAMSPS
jgi:hypothetical protein